MITISKKYTFSAHHELRRDDWTDEENRAAFGKCMNKHGHNYELEVTLAGSVVSDDGMILNYYKLDELMEGILDRVDHESLNEAFGVLPTAENLVRMFAELIEVKLEANAPTDVWLFELRLSETDRTSAVWHA